MKKTKHLKNSEELKEELVYNSYPTDIWFLISENIQVEDIQSFGLINLQTAYVVSMPQFWLKIYKKYYNEDFLHELPDRLKPDCIVRQGGLRAAVIRSLFIMHPPFRLALRDKDKDNYDKANRKLCVNVSTNFDDVRKIWTYCFKIKNRFEMNRQLNSFEKKISTKERKILGDIFLNPDEGCQLVIVRLKHFVPIAQFRDEIPTIKSIQKTLSRGFVNYKLTIVLANYNGTQQLSDPIVFDPIISVKMVDWWSPEYTLYQELGS